MIYHQEINKIRIRTVPIVSMQKPLEASLNIIEIEAKDGVRFNLITRAHDIKLNKNNL